MQNPITMGEVRKFLEKRVRIMLYVLIIWLLILTAAVVAGLQTTAEHFDKVDSTFNALAEELGNFERDQAQVNAHFQYENDENDEWNHETTQFINRRSYDLLQLEYEVEELLKFKSFPWISQKDDGAREYEDDCASAAALMVASYYGVDNGETVDYLHLYMAGGDYVVDWKTLNNFLQGYFQLETQVIVTDQAILDSLINVYGEEAVEDIMVVETYFWDDTPVIWIYGSHPHWIVRFMHYAYDPAQGMIPFDSIPNIYKPWRGLGIIVKESLDE